MGLFITAYCLFGLLCWIGVMLSTEFKRLLDDCPLGTTRLYYEIFMVISALVICVVAWPYYLLEAKFRKS